MNDGEPFFNNLPKETPSREEGIGKKVHQGSPFTPTTEGLVSNGQNGPVCKDHYERDCKPCYRTLDRLVDQGMKPKFAMTEVYLDYA